VVLQPALTLAFDSSGVNSGNTDAASWGLARRDECITVPALLLMRFHMRTWCEKFEMRPREVKVIRSYIYASCTSCRKTDAWLKDSGADYVSRDYFRDRFSRDELTRILNDARLPVRDVLSTRSKVYKDNQSEIDGLSDDALLGRMIDEPTLLRRPIVIGAGGAIVGHNPKRLEALVLGDDD